MAGMIFPTLAAWSAASGTSGSSAIAPKACAAAAAAAAAACPVLPKSAAPSWTAPKGEPLVLLSLGTLCGRRTGAGVQMFATPPGLDLCRYAEQQHVTA